MLTLTPGDPQLRHLDRAWCSTVHSFQGRTVDKVIAAMEANHPTLTTQKSFYVEISRARDRAELVTDDARALKERLEAVTGEPMSALEGNRRGRAPGARGAMGSRAGCQRARARPARRLRHLGGSRRPESATKRPPGRKRRRPGTGPAPSTPDREVGREAPQRKAPEPPAKTRVREMDLSL